MRAERLSGLSGLSGLRPLSSEAASSSPLPGGGRQEVLRAHPPDRSAASADFRPRVLGGLSKAVRSHWRVDQPPQVETPGEVNQGRCTWGTKRPQDVHGSVPNQSVAASCG